MGGQAATRLLVVIGTRPEAIKLAPIIRRAREADQDFETFVVTTSQHREMLDQMLDVFEIEVNRDLNIMKPNQDLSHITTAALEGLYATVDDVEPDCVLVQGDTTTTFAGALAGFYRGVPVAHIEAGLRTFDKTQPFPEEVNRRLVTQIADFHFAPTEAARGHLLREGVDPERIHVTGNTSIDSLFLMLDQQGAPAERGSAEGPQLLLTAHRRENLGEPMERICDSMLSLLEEFPRLQVLFPVHLSPKVRATVFGRLGQHERVKLVDPLDYLAFVDAMNTADLIVTDSGGVQEEAPSLGKPVLVLRETTERPEGIEAGCARLVGTDPQKIQDEVGRLLNEPERYRQMAKARSPYGDGQAAKRILDTLAGLQKESA